MRAFAALIGAATLALTSLVVAPVAAPAAAAGYCADGVVVLVDFGRLDGGIQRGCAQSPKNGWDALQTAKFEVTGTSRYPGSFVCRIDGQPTPAQDPCRNTPPASAYWSYWKAGNGQNSWSYSHFGASAPESRPDPGAVEGWAFGATDVGGTTGGPSVCPDYARTLKQSACPSSGGGAAPNPGRTTASSHRQGGDSDGGSRRGSEGNTRGGSEGSSSTRSSDGSSAGGTSARRSSSASGSASSSSPSASASSSTAVDAPRSGSQLPTIVDASEVAGKNASGDGGSAGPAVLGIVLVALLAGGAGWTVLRRRRADAADL